jgi:maleamate amidohydrolase
VSEHDEGFGSALGWGIRPALLVIDMMCAYFTEGSPLCLPDRSAVQGCAQLLAVAREAEIPVIHTRVAYAPGLADAGMFVRKVPALALLTHGAPLGKFDPDVCPRPDETVVVKQYASAFFGTSLASTLYAAGIDTTIICGVSTSGCVRATATDALQHGFAPIVVRDACADRTAAIHNTNLYDLAAKYADVADVADVAARISALK